MRCYVAVSGGCPSTGGWSQCLHWATQQIKENDSAAVKIHIARGGEKHARVVAEITKDGFKSIKSGRSVAIKKLMDTPHGKE